jgi:hypothetical protein
VRPERSRWRRMGSNSINQDRKLNHHRERGPVARAPSHTTGHAGPHPAVRQRLDTSRSINGRSVPSVLVAPPVTAVVNRTICARLVSRSTPTPHRGVGLLNLWSPNVRGPGMCRSAGVEGCRSVEPTEGSSLFFIVRSFPVSLVCDRRHYDLCCCTAQHRLLDGVPRFQAKPYSLERRLALARLCRSCADKNVMLRCTSSPFT